MPKTANSAFASRSSWTVSAAFRSSQRASRARYTLSITTTASRNGSPDVRMAGSPPSSIASRNAGSSSLESARSVYAASWADAPPSSSASRSGSSGSSQSSTISRRDTSTDRVSRAGDSERPTRSARSSAAASARYAESRSTSGRSICRAKRTMLAASWSRSNDSTPALARLYAG